MITAPNLNTAFEKAKTIAQESQNLRTEEDAKIQIITRILTECLGWSFTDIVAEKSHDNGFSDYVLSIGGSPVLVIEAKRAGAVKIGGTEKGKMRHLKISGASLKDTISGIEQAASYAMPHGIPVAVLTDGLAWIAFKTFIPGKSYKDKQAIVFPSMDAVVDNFSEFYDLFSKVQVRRRLYNSIFDDLHHDRTFLGQALKAPIEQSEIKRLQKSTLAFDLDKFFYRFFERLSDDQDEDFLVECFVESRESRIADFALEKIATNVLGNISPAEKDVDQELVKLIKAAVDINSGQTVFVVGPTGAGKSTFLERFFRKTLPTAVQRRCLVMKVNCLDFSGREEAALDWLTEELIRLLEREIYHEGSPSWDELRGLYFAEYQRKSHGADSRLYQRDREAFKDKFSSYLERAVESDRESYLKRILSDVVKNRKLLPIIVLDNTDEFTLENKTNLFQFSQSLARSMQHCLLIFPMTDKSAWSFSKTDIFGIYRSQSYFLPTPPPREVFRKRVEFIKQRLASDAEGEKQRNYFASRGISVSIENLNGVAEILESVFVNNDYASKLIGQISNYNIRRTLNLSRRVITSSVFNIDDLLKSLILEEMPAISMSKFVRAMMKGDYEAYRKDDAHEVFPVFQVDTQIRQSPLLNLRILQLLQVTKNSGRSIDDRHMELQPIVEYFGSMGCAETAVEKALLSLLEAKLIEAFDASVQELSPDQRLSITHSGQAHLRLATDNGVFFEQMAITTAITDEEVATRLQETYSSKSQIPQKMDEIRRTFVTYLLEEDGCHITEAPDLPQYESQRELIDKLRRFSMTQGDPPQREILFENVRATVDWFDATNMKYGFVEVDEVEGNVFLHAKTLQSCNIDQVSDGDELLCDIGRNTKGIHVAKIHSIQTDRSSISRTYCKVVRLFLKRGYGFVQVNGGPDSAYFHLSAVPRDDRDKLDVGATIEAEIGPDKSGSGLQVRRVLSIQSVAT